MAARGRVANEGRAGHRVPGQHVDHAGREQAVAKLAEAQAGNRGLLGLLDDDRVAGGQGRGDLFGAEPEGMVEGADLGHHAVRLTHGEVQVARAVGESFPLYLPNQAGEAF